MKDRAGEGRYKGWWGPHVTYCIQIVKAEPGWNYDRPGSTPNLDNVQIGEARSRCITRLPDLLPGGSTVTITSWVPSAVSLSNANTSLTDPGPSGGRTSSACSSRRGQGGDRHACRLAWTRAVPR